MEKNNNKKLGKYALQKFAIRLGLITEEEIERRRRLGIPWNAKPKK